MPTNNTANPNQYTLGHWHDTKITSAQILAIYTTPIKVAPACPSKHVNIFDGALIVYDYATAYASVNDLAIYYTNGSGQACCTAVTASGFLDASSDQIRYAPTLGGVAGSVAALTPVDGAALVITCGTGNPTTGTSTLFVRCYYHVAPTIL